MRTPDSLNALVDHGIIEQVLRPLMSGKEAQIYLVLSGGEPRVAKIYKEAQNRTFQNRADYTEGRKVRNSRDQRAMSSRSRHGRAQNEAAWKSAEVDMIYRLRDAGVRVPTPYHFIDGVLIMELVTDAEGFPAPRLGDLTLEPDEATEVFDKVLREVVRMLCAGVVHGDLSDFNVLMSAEGPVVIDFPQAVDASSNANARKLLLRDVDNLHRFHAKFAPGKPALPYAQEMWDLYQRNALTPDTRLSGTFRTKQRAVSTDAVLDLIADADHDERRRREARGLSMRGTTVVEQPPQARPETRFGAGQRGPAPRAERAAGRGQGPAAAARGDARGGQRDRQPSEPERAAQRLVNQPGAREFAPAQAAQPERTATRDPVATRSVRSERVERAARRPAAGVDSRGREPTSREPTPREPRHAGDERAREGHTRDERPSARAPQQQQQAPREPRHPRDEHARDDRQAPRAPQQTREAPCQERHARDDRQAPRAPQQTREAPRQERHARDDGQAPRAPQQTREAPRQERHARDDRQAPRAPQQTREAPRQERHARDDRQAPRAPQPTREGPRQERHARDDRQAPRAPQQTREAPRQERHARDDRQAPRASGSDAEAADRQGARDDRQRPQLGAVRGGSRWGQREDRQVVARGREQARTPNSPLLSNRSSWPAPQPDGPLLSDQPIDGGHAGSRNRRR